MAEKISAPLRRIVRERANEQCEYCLLPQTFAAHKHEPDHIIPIQHGGDSSAENLALACFYCNRYKGPNVGSFDNESGLLTPFFHPRQHVWREHFRLADGEIKALSAEARVTLNILKINTPTRIKQRQKLQQLGIISA